MAKETGLGITTLSIDDSGGTARAIINDITDFNVSTPRPEQDVTGIDKSAMERLLLLADYTLTLNMIFNDAASVSSHAVFADVSSTSVARTATLVVSAQTLPAELLFTDYNLTRATDGSLTSTTTGVLADGTVPTWA